MINHVGESEMNLLVSTTSNQWYGSARKQHQGPGNWPPAEVGCDLDFEGMSGIQISNDYIKRHAFERTEGS